MYYPIQIPFILNRDFFENASYTEEVDARFDGFVICFWEMQSLKPHHKTVNNVIVTDGCIDLVVEPIKKRIGFSGMSATNFHYEIQLPAWFFGARLSPGVFHLLTGRPATDVMDDFLPLSEIDSTFDQERFFSLTPKKAKAETKALLQNLMKGKKPNEFTQLFDRFCDDPPVSTTSFCDTLHFSQRQCQRLFRMHFGLSPKMVLSILRFQRCLSILYSGKADPGDILGTTAYYDQAHMIKDFKRNLGITPLQLINLYK